MKTDYISAAERTALPGRKNIFHRAWLFLTSVQEF